MEQMESDDFNKARTMSVYKKTIVEFFEETLATHGDKIAIEDNGRTATFRMLTDSAFAIAVALRQMTGETINRPIGVFIGKSIESVAADLGILYAGHAYMNLDVKMPGPRTRNILERIAPAVVITTPRYAETLASSWPSEKTFVLNDRISPASPEQVAILHANLERVIDTDPLCIINTSGSTGTPKGVVLNHRSFIDYTFWAIEVLQIRASDILGSIAPVVFDHSSYEFCLMLLRGCTLVFVPESFAMFPVKLLQLLADRAITYIFWVPTLMVNIANMDLLSRIALPKLRLACFAGEVFPTKQFNYWRRHLPDTTFVNLYGPTEITVDCTYYIVDRELRDDEPIPIGHPCRNTDILILNDRNELAADGEEGELCVRGSSLAMGYYNDPEKTGTAFVQNPLNTSYPERIYRTGDIVFVNERGEMVYKGRNDSLIKHMGKRVELGEIEHVVVNTLALVNNGCAVYDHGRREIVFFYEAEEIILPGDFRKAISAILPNYMVPSRFVLTSEMPRNTNGKIDRALLNKQVNG